MRAVAAVCIAALLMSCGGERPRSSPQPQGVTIARSGQARARIVVVSEGVAIKETGPPETIKKFGEVYAFVPQTLIVRRDEPTQIEFWNLQADDKHDFMLTDPRNKVLLKTDLGPLSKTVFVMTFHEEGLFPFYCAMHQPAMSGQILVVSGERASRPQSRARLARSRSSTWQVLRAPNTVSKEARVFLLPRLSTSPGETPAECGRDARVPLRRRYRGRYW